jgi:hypothetical protein
MASSRPRAPWSSGGRSVRGTRLTIPPLLLQRADEIIERRAGLLGDSLDHLVSPHEKSGRDREPKRPGGLQVDDEMEPV